MVYWLRLSVSLAGYTGSIPGWGARILRAEWPSQNNKQTRKATPNHNPMGDLLLSL